MDFKVEFLSQFFEEIEPKEFYRFIFPEGELQERNIYDDGKYNAIAVELGKDQIKRYTITDDLGQIDNLLGSDNFVIVSPISYAGKKRTSDNARNMYALAIDLDGVNSKMNMIDLFHQIDKVEHIPRPTFVVTSGNGFHLYYVFEQPIPLFRNVVVQLTRLKNDLTKKIWNSYVTDLFKKVQYQSIYQGFRLVGGVTKQGDRTRAFQTGDRVTIEYLNDFCIDHKNKMTEFSYKSKLSRKEAEKKYPEWYQNRVIDGKPKGTWVANRAVYDWWKRKLEEIQEGHRYYGVMCLAIYARKCGISKEELEEDAFKMVERLDQLTTDEHNHFTREDVLAALELYNDNYITFPIDAISQLTDLKIEKNKRRKTPLKRDDGTAFKIARMIQELQDPNGNWRNKEGRPKGSSKQREIIERWKKEHPEGKPKDCVLDTGISKNTVYRWWKQVEKED